MHFKEIIVFKFEQRHMLALKEFVFTACEHVACMGACFGSCSKSSDVLSADQASKLSSLPKRRESHTERDFWSSSSNEVDPVTSSKLSQSLSSSKQNQSTESFEANSSPRRGDLNYGIALWTEQRREWTRRTSEARPPENHEAIISWASTYEDLLSTSRPFPRPIPLSEMVDFLVEVWEQEGLYD
ncbi:hypothetical protein KP509_39G008000 [Ceratopteris richardii]|uniref:Gag1-like clamp domain-containing protein n=1 Tax=Ceratopteris richardii TaxID=49495 RepID=A0A8T2PYH2_CERRI|nr:hypothetical protein KP509_39G008000 [Ceratopteris richardii]